MEAPSLTAKSKKDLISQTRYSASLKTRPRFFSSLDPQGRKKDPAHAKVFRFLIFRDLSHPFVTALPQGFIDHNGHGVREV